MSKTSATSGTRLVDSIRLSLYRSTSGLAALAAARFAKAGGGSDLLGRPVPDTVSEITREAYGVARVALT